jgi:hypothetical protein
VSGGGGGRSTCTTDLSTFDQTCTSSGGVGANTEDFSGGGGNRITKDFDFEDQSDILTATGGGGFRSGEEAGGSGGKVTCTADPTTGGEFVCS